MKKISGFILIVAAATIGLYGCSNKKDDAQKTSTSNNAVKTNLNTKLAKANEKTNSQSEVKWPYYEIKKDGEVKGHILGTVHAGKEEMYPFPDRIIDDLNNSEKHITELGELSDEESVEATEAMQTAMLSDEPLTSEMSDEAKTKYQKILSTYDLNVEELESLSRYGIYMFLMSTALTNNKGTSNDLDEQAKYGVEEQLKSVTDKKKTFKIIGLETPLEQNNIIIEAQSKPENINDWVNTLLTKEENENSPSNGGAIEEYIQGKNDFSDQNPEQLEIMNYSRNKAWADILPEYLGKENESFIAVGNAHLYGERGIVELLRQKGYDVTEVKF